ncbi:MAG: ribose 5-phosphate isomerase B [Chloroflexi bacterium]|nr:ribose 5-phosphate isomerase B [Chloroflexota bacterium]
MEIAIGCDHRGVRLKQTISNLLAELGYVYVDFGCSDDATRVDYPDFAKKVAEAVASGQFERGILVCSTGVGMSIAANKVKGIRAALCHEPLSARRSRQHTDANVLCLGQDIVGQDLALEIVETFLASDFEGGRHAQRLRKIGALESKE